jgi:trehalose-6-phosphate synthase
MKINLNDGVKFKINEDGEKYIANLNSTHSIYRRYPISFPKDKDGYSNAQLWELFHYFGDAIYLGCLTPFGTEIIIDNL